MSITSTDELRLDEPPIPLPPRADSDPQYVSIDGQDLKIGQYSVLSRGFVQRVAGTLMCRSVERNRPLPVSITAALGLVEEDANALSMKQALMAIPNLYERRAILCKMIHRINQLSGTLPPPVSLGDALRTVSVCTAEGVRALGSELASCYPTDVHAAERTIRAMPMDVRDQTVRRLDDLLHGRRFARVDLSKADGDLSY